MSYKGKSYKNDGCNYRNYVQEQKDIAQAKVDVAEGGLIAMVVDQIIMFVAIVIGCVLCGG